MCEICSTHSHRARQAAYNRSGAGRTKSKATSCWVCCTRSLWCRLYLLTGNLMLAILIIIFTEVHAHTARMNHAMLHAFTLVQALLIHRQSHACHFNSYSYSYSY